VEDIDRTFRALKDPRWRDFEYVAAIYKKGKITQQHHQYRLCENYGIKIEELKQFQWRNR
jgi:hypothetical protein